MPEVVQSARWVAAQRVRESERTDRLFFDPLAPALSGEEGMAALQLSEKYNPRHEETANYIAIRTRFFDDVAQHDATAGARQIVLPAAGMDARAYRISWPDGTTLYEIDHPELLAAKEKILQAQLRVPECRRVTISADLTQDWIHLLVDSGFRSNERSTWLIEGLFYYFDEPAVNRILMDVSRLAAPGSVLVTDLVNRSLLTSPWMQQALKAMEEQGMGWRFGTDDPVRLLAVHGWDAAVKDPGEEGARYDSQRFPVQPRRSWSFFVLARRM